MEEDSELAELLESESLRNSLTQEFRIIWDELQAQQVFNLYDRETIAEGILSKIPLKTGDDRQRLGRIKFERHWLMYAAIILVILFVGLFYFVIPVKDNSRAIVTSKNDTSAAILPGTQKAILTLADGTQVDLNSVEEGIIEHKDNGSVVKLANGQLAYIGSGATSDKEQINTISTPRGGHYQVILADGSKVWLNASSSLTYPMTFSGSQRKVNLTGEAYFEVAKNADKPFVVEVSGIAVNVLGTQFNVNAYEQEYEIKTTLIEGSVNVSREGLNAVLKPGQQAAWQNGREQFILSEVDIEQVVAWKNGLFIFNSDRLSTIMHQLSIWYDFEFEFKDDVSQKTFSGIISRNDSITNVLDKLALTKEVAFKIEARKVLVSR